jgi:hypothetical protein
MISIIRPLSSGNALRVFIEPPAGAKNWRVLRKGSDTFTDQDDPSALRAYEGTDKNFVDVVSLQNEVMAFYKPFYWNGADWIPAATVNGTPAATYEDLTQDVVKFLRERLEAGLMVEVKRGNFVPEHGYIQVFTAPPAMSQDLSFPLVTLELDSASPADRAVGEDYGIGMDDPDSDEGDEAEGWLERVAISVLGWSLNSNERIELRNAMRRVLLANLSILDAHGFQQVSFSFTDINAINGEYGPPVYQALCNFTCLAAARITSRVGTITDIEVSVTDPQP